MSEAYVEGGDAPEPGDGEDAPEQEDGGEVEQDGEEGEGEGDEDGEDGDAAARLKRAEKQVHDKAALAAKERSKRRAAERQTAELTNRLEALEKRGTTDTDDLAKLIQELREDDDEPITDINQIKRVLKTILTRQEAARQEEGQRSAVVEVVQSISRNMDAYEKDFAEDHPDYVQAATFYRTARVEELEALGYSGDRLMQKVAGEFFNLANDIMKDGRDPAEVVYGLAKKRGFKAGATAATAKLQKLQQAGSSAASPRAKGADNGITWERVAKAKGAEKDRLWSKLRAQELGKT